MEKNNRIVAYDLIRSACILTVFFAHILSKQVASKYRYRHPSDARSRTPVDLRSRRCGNPSPLDTVPAACLLPIGFCAMLFYVTPLLPKSVMKAVVLFSSLSYEFYILHFYFINGRFYPFLPASLGLVWHVIIEFAIVFALSFVLSRTASVVRRRLNRYLLPSAVT